MYTLKPFKHYWNSLGQRYCTIRYLRSRKMVNLIWKGTATREGIQEVAVGLRKLISQYPSRSILNDVQEFHQGPADYLMWSDWDMKGLVEEGIRCIAYVLPPEDTLPEPIEYSSQTPEVKFFRHTMDAVEWLNEQNLL
ncbi:hypothetical protein [Pontibacter amylolyticus]|uniref:STAS/SEC14 domain-containing protein n=1 Tax=Pontibacter amylolyticus TaxID=1424080 RepID=A0ABQ1W683_9BACT|nr:hypothetical protein [Pontibacter amylolyticus]GGG15744.1 hypothetical protein GCM10011323_20180 [Pontibacter amylolyticus]